MKILSHIVASYVKTGEPVGSKGIADKIGVSSATVRNEMAELTERGYLEQPHTSAGRIPSQKGYRRYIDVLPQSQKISKDDKAYFDSFLSNIYDPEKLLFQSAHSLSRRMKVTSVVTTPGESTSSVRGVQFVQITRRTAMLILMSSSGIIKNRLFHCEFDLSSEVMRVLFRAFNERLADIRLTEITRPFLQSMGESLGELSALSVPAILALYELTQEMMLSELIVSGKTNLFFFPELAREGQLRAIMELLEDKEDMSELLNQKQNRVVAIIGSETNKRELSDAALVVSRYSVDGYDAGAISILGPMRLDYKEAFSVLRYVSDSVSDMLTTIMRDT